MKREHIPFLLEVAGSINSNTIISELQSLSVKAKSGNTPIILPFIGEFSSGKTTLINALTDSHALETATRPTTATIYEVHFGAPKNCADIIFEDYKIQLPKDRYTIIHNCIDTDMFQYVKKDSGQRKKILSIRPYASNVYANDLMAECIKELSAKPYFEELQFRIIGNGALFDEITKPLKKFHNVVIEKKFLRQEEIAKLHKEYGIFLVPTRADTQGVSRDEAMASGLVPVTNAVAAIPEFTDENCAVLAPAEDYQAMASGIDSLVQSEQTFLQMSENAAKRVRSQSDRENTIERELALICEG